MNIPEIKTASTTCKIADTQCWNCKQPLDNGVFIYGRGYVHYPTCPRD